MEHVESKIKVPRTFKRLEKKKGLDLIRPFLKQTIQFLVNDNQDSRRFLHENVINGKNV
ncbi:hypothetical protein FRB90_000972, partial [Tulasnella sp. 427]